MDVFSVFVGPIDGREVEDMDTDTDPDAHTFTHIHKHVCVEVCVFGATMSGQTTLQPTHMVT